MCSLYITITITITIIIIIITIFLTEVLSWKMINKNTIEQSVTTICMLVSLCA
jgi:hypothetical protein